ncbi:hypothetical protein DIE23_28955 [Burkholderia sp. Bp9143]|nr:hypothetical protein DIE23_28955 [Burkholderia sp. Bp9143]
MRHTDLAPSHAIPGDQGRSSGGNGHPCAGERPIWSNASSRRAGRSLGRVAIRIISWQTNSTTRSCHPSTAVRFIASGDIGDAVRFGYHPAASPTLFRHYAAVRIYLNVKPHYGTDANAIATPVAHDDDACTTFVRS